MKHETPRRRACYSIQLKRAANVVGQLYDQFMEPTGLTISQFSLLNDILSMGECSKMQLAEYAHLDKSTITRNLRLLHARGFIDDSSARDSRESRISVTLLGREKIAAGRVVWTQVQKHLRDRVGEKKMKDLMEILALIETVA